jgi:predicted RNA-binding Zn ribbon-like protein
VVSEKVPPFAVEVGGILLPKPISGHPALELCNTVAGWDDPPEHRKEWLTTSAHLATWASFTGLVGNHHRVDDTVLAEVRELRAVAYRLLRHRDATAFPSLARYADDANAHTSLTRADDGSVRFTLARDNPLHAAALAVVDLLGRPERDTVRACPGEGCGWLFLDPRGRRVWCSMAACGNRVKVRAHAARTRSNRGSSTR